MDRRGVLRGDWAFFVLDLWGAGAAAMTIRLPVIAPECCTVHGRRPMWEKAFKDPRGVEYGLHLPYDGGDCGEGKGWGATTRVFFDRRQYRAELHRKRIKSVGPERGEDGVWGWVVEVNG